MPSKYALGQKSVRRSGLRWAWLSNSAITLPFCKHLQILALSLITATSVLASYFYFFLKPSSSSFLVTPDTRTSLCFFLHCSLPRDQPLVFQGPNSYQSFRSQCQTLPSLESYLLPESHFAYAFLELLLMIYILIIFFILLICISIFPLDCKR